MSVPRMAFLSAICVICIFTGTVSAEVYDFGYNYDNGQYIGQISLNEDGTVNSVVVAGIANGGMEVCQGTYESEEGVITGQMGDMGGDSGFAATKVNDGNGNSAGSFASFTEGSMYFGQVSGFGDAGVGSTESFAVEGVPTEVEESMVFSGQVVGSSDFSTINALSYSHLADGSSAAVYAQAQGTGQQYNLASQEAFSGSDEGIGSLFGVLQVAYAPFHTGFKSYGETESPSPIFADWSFAIAREWVAMVNVESGSASAYAVDPNGNSATLETYVQEGTIIANDIEGRAGQRSMYLPTYEDIPEYGEIDIEENGLTSKAVAKHDWIFVYGESGGILLDTENSIGSSAFVHAEFSSDEGGYIRSGYDFPSKAVVGQSENYYKVLAKDNPYASLNGDGSYLLETGTSDASGMNSDYASRIDKTDKRFIAKSVGITETDPPYDDYRSRIWKP